MSRILLILPIVTILVLSTACTSNKENGIEKTVDEFYETYNHRKNFNRFIDFYADNIVLEDIINGDRIEGKEELKKFFDWNNPGLVKLDSNTLVISEKIVGKNKATIKGYFTKFKWGETEFEAMHFTTLLTFNTSGKIIKQVDWINYPSNLVNYNERKNSNEWLLK